MNKHITMLFIVFANIIAGASVYLLITHPLVWLAGALVLYVVTLIMYGYLMCCSYSLKHIGPFSKELMAFSTAAKVVGYLLDYTLNASVFSILLFRAPAETTVTECLNKYGTAPGWRGRVARYFGARWINPLELVSRPHINIGE